jgi:hemerythrin-like metal-binding protein
MNSELQTLMLSESEAPQSANEEQDPGRSRKILAAINRALEPYHRHTEPRELLDRLLADIIDLTDSEYGFFGAVLHQADGQPYMKIEAIPNIRRKNATGASAVAQLPRLLDITQPECLFGAVLNNGETVIANAPSAAEVPPGYPALESFLGFPFNAVEGLSGALCVANNTDGYEESLADDLTPLLKTYLLLFNAQEIEQEKCAALSSLRESEQLIRGMAVPAVEHEHDELIELINECYEEMEREADAGAIVELFEQTYSAIARHFLHEEQLMRNAIFPGYVEHKENHDRLLSTLRENIDRFIADPDHDVYLLQKTLADWFGRHVATFDLRLNEHFSN